MSITNSNIYQDLIMNPDYMPNRLQSLEMFPPVDVPGRIDFSSGDELVPGMGTPAIDFTDAPVENFFLRQNNPTKGFLDRNFNYRALNLGTPEATAKFLAKKNFSIPPNLQGIDTRGFIDKTKSNISSGISKGINLGKTAIGGVASLLTGLPGIGILANLLPERDYRQGVLEDFYSDPNTRGLMSQIPGMDQYNIVSGGLLNALTSGKTGDETTYGLSGAIDKRMETIKKTLKKKKSAVLQQRLKDLQALKDREAKALKDARDKAAAELESKRRGRRPGTGGGGPGVQDSGGPTGGYSYDSGGREGFGYGL
jgi:hypothetical protein|tara:strand:+ start:8482 stop:9414 length:933 start_codon:yes stop_codon:yes gene_type:complete